MEKIEIEESKTTLWVGDSAEVLKQYPDNHFDSVVTDAPYGIEFLGKDWDNNTGAIEVWKECLRVLKPGGYLLSFGAPRTYHRLATNLEDIGFEIKDSLMWLFGSGFPKAQDVGKRLAKRDGTEASENKYDGWKTGLKPAHEPIVMCRKPTKLTATDNMVEWGVGALNIDATRIPYEDEADKNVGGRNKGTTYENNMFQGEAYKFDSKTKSVLSVANNQGRFPSNVIMSEEVGRDLDEKMGIKQYGNKKGGYKYDKTYNVEGFIKNNKPDSPSNYGDGGGVSKYFYCPKVNRKERHIGLDVNAIDKISQATMSEHPLWDESMGTDINRLKNKIQQGVANANTHPTIKPIALMLYLVKLITPPNGKVLDCFNGSGSTGMAVKEFGGEYVGIDLDENYIEISRKRILAWDSK